MQGFIAHVSHGSSRVSRWRPLGILSATAGLAIAATGGAPSSATARALSAGLPNAFTPPCTTRTWTAQRLLLTRDDHRAFTERPVVVPTADGLVLLGTPTLELDSSGMPVVRARPAGAADSVAAVLGSGVWVRDSTAVILPLPPGATAFAEPQAVDADGVVHVLWSEPVAAGDRRSIVWYARLRAGAWTAPESVTTLAEPAWDHWHTSALLAARGELHLVVPLSGVLNVGAAYVHRSRDGWHVTMFAPGRTSIAYARLLVDANGGLELAFISGGSTNEGKWNRVYVARSVDSGSTWSTPEQVGEPWTGPAYDLAFASTDSLTYLSWIERPLRPASLPDLEDSVRVVWRPRASGTWRRGASLPVPHNSSGLRVALDASGTLHAVLREGSAESRLLIATWNGMQWQVARPPFAPAASLPAIAATPGDSLVLVWGTARQSVVGPSPQSLVAVSPPCR